MGKLAGMTYGKVKNNDKVPEGLNVEIIDFEKELQEMDFETKRKGRELTAWSGALSIVIRFTVKGNTVTTRYGANVQNGHEEKLEIKETYDYVSTKISNYLKDKDSDS